MLFLKEFLAFVSKFILLIYKLIIDYKTFIITTITNSFKHVVSLVDTLL